MLQISTFGRLYNGLSCITHLFQFLTNPNHTLNQLKFQYCAKIYLIQVQRNSGAMEQI